MIQRIQSLYLLLASGCTVLMFFIPIYAATMQDDSIKNYTASNNFFLFLSSVILVAIPFITIFFYKNRKLQMKLVWLSVIATIAVGTMIYIQATNFQSTFASNYKSFSFKVAAALPVATLVLLFMAYAGIRSDERLIKQVDRLR